MFERLDYLLEGTKKQKEAYEAITELQLLGYLKEYQPILCGTLPLEIYIEGSDLDIIMEVHHFPLFEEKVQKLFGHCQGFTLKRTLIRDVLCVKANFYYDGFEFELFGQPQPVFHQYAYLHMIIEYFILKADPTVKEQVVNLKKQGLKTEPAFCEVLGIDGDPYEELINYGKKKGYISL